MLLRSPGVPVEKHGVNSDLRQKGKIAVLAYGYGGSVGALKAMGALTMGLAEEELKPIVDAWRDANPCIVELWGDVEHAAIAAITTKRSVRLRNLRFIYEAGMLFIELPSRRRLSYVKPGLGRTGSEANSSPTGAWARTGSGSSLKPMVGS